jgi:hypothetical protein
LAQIFVGDSGILKNAYFSMMELVQLNKKFSILPPELKKEVNDFIDYLLTKSKNEEKMAKPVFGSAKGKIVIAPDFDDELEEFKEYM